MSEWGSISKPLKVAELGFEPIHVSRDADAADRASIAESFGLQDISLLKAEMDVSRHRSLIRVAGSIEAELGRTCVVSLEPMRERISEDFAVEFTTDLAGNPGAEAELDLDAPEPIEGDSLDLGDVMIEQLVLAMDPHPRKADAKPPKDLGTGEGSSPFDVLKGLKA